jgi:3-deoxy-7-phosphoheptulonate synthase
MIIVLKRGAADREIDEVADLIESAGLRPHLSKGTERTIIGAIGDERLLDPMAIEALNQVEQVLPVLKPYKLASREMHPDDTVVEVGRVAIGGRRTVVMAGPCSVESPEQLQAAAGAVRDAGASVLRGSAYKPRTSPYSFQGLGEQGLQFLRDAREQTGLPVETEVMDPRKVEVVSDYVDILRVGARNMQNYDLLREVGRGARPVILKNGLSSTLDEFLMAAEYILNEGNPNVVLCLRGIRTFETTTRFTLDLALVAAIRERSHLPVIVDPSHPCGQRSMVGPTSCAAIAAGADGLIVEVHPDPEHALSDGPQQLTIPMFEDLMTRLRSVAEAMDREL